MTKFNVPESFKTAINLQVTLDGAGYTATIAWNVFGQRNYVTILDQFGNRVVTIPLIGSPPSADYTYTNTDFVQTTNNKTITLALNRPINIIAGYFQTSAMYYYPQDQTLVVTP